MDTSSVTLDQVKRPLGAYTNAADDTTTTLDSSLFASPVGVASTTLSSKLSLIGGSFNPITVVGATPTLTPKAPTVDLESSGDPQISTQTLAPLMQVGDPGSPGVPLFGFDQTTGAWDKSPLNQSTWLGGDPLTGVSGDTGGLGGVGASWTTSSATTETDYAAPGASWFASAKAQINSGDYRDALQQDYNNLTWDVNNLNISTTNTQENIPQSILTLQSNDQVSSAWSAVACAGTAVGVAAGAFALAQPGGNTTSNKLGLVSAITGAAAACNQMFPSILETPDPSYYPLASADMDLASFLGDDVGFVGRAGGFTIADSTSAGKPMTMSSLSSAPGMTMTPGFAPSQSYLDAVKGHLTAAAEAKYFPHG